MKPSSSCSDSSEPFLETLLSLLVLLPFPELDLAGLFVGVLVGTAAHPPPLQGLFLYRMSISVVFGFKQH